MQKVDPQLGSILLPRPSSDIRSHGNFHLGEVRDCEEIVTPHPYVSSGATFCSHHRALAPAMQLLGACIRRKLEEGLMRARDNEVQRSADSATNGPEVGGNTVPRAGVQGFSAAALQRVMARQGVRADELAELAGVSRQSVSAWLNSVTVPSPENLATVAQVLLIEIAQLTPGVGDVKLSDLRAWAGKSQTSAAAELQVSRTSLGELERGQRRDLPEHLVDAMAALYRVEPGEVVNAWENTRSERVEHLADRSAARRRQR